MGHEVLLDGVLYLSELRRHGVAPSLEDLHRTVHQMFPLHAAHALGVVVVEHAAELTVGEGCDVFGGVGSDGDEEQEEKDTRHLFLRQKMDKTWY